jgi:hypothetical protein
LLPAIPITSPQFVYRRARETDVRLTFARARLESSSERDWLAEGGVLAPRRVLPRES